MATHISFFQSATTLARAGSTFTIQSASNALVDDSSWTDILAITPPVDGYTDYLVVQNLVDKVPIGATITAIQFEVLGHDSDTDTLTVITSGAARFIQNGALAGTDISTSDQLNPADDSELSYPAVAGLGGLTWVAGNGAGATDINNALSGFAISYQIDQTTAGGDGYPAINRIRAIITYTAASGGATHPPTSRVPIQARDKDMDTYNASQGNGFHELHSEALPSVSSSAQIFANAPKNTAWIELTVRVATLCVRHDGEAATTAAGNDYAVGTHQLVFSQEQAKKVRAIQSGGTTTGWITYWGRGNPPAS